MHEFAKDGCSNSLPLKIFYSTDEHKEANFALVIKDYYEQLVSNSCYIAFFEDDDDDDDVKILSDDENEFPMPKRPTRKELN